MWKILKEMEYIRKVTCFILLIILSLPFVVDTPSKALVCGRSHAAIAGSNPAGGMDVCLFECCVLAGRGFCIGLITRPECDGEPSIMRRHLKRQCEADERSTYLHILFPCYANIFHHLRLYMNQVIFYFQNFFPLDLLCVYPARATCLFDPIILDFIASVVFLTFDYARLPVLAALIAKIPKYTPLKLHPVHFPYTGLCLRILKHVLNQIWNKPLPLN